MELPRKYLEAFYSHLEPMHQMEMAEKEKDRVDMLVALEFARAACEQIEAGEEPFFFGSKHLAELVELRQPASPVEFVADRDLLAS